MVELDSQHCSYSLMFDEEEEAFVVYVQATSRNDLATAAPYIAKSPNQ